MSLYDHAELGHWTGGKSRLDRHDLASARVPTLPRNRSPSCVQQSCALSSRSMAIVWLVKALQQSAGDRDWLPSWNVGIS
jgi:hypothetical protein